MSTDPIADLLGDTPQPQESRKPDLEAQLAKRVEQQKLQTPGTYMQPVTTQFLGTVFGLHANTVAKQLAKCPVAEYKPHGGKMHPRYHFREAIQYLVEPKVDIATWIANSKHFPPELNKSFWEAMRVKQKWQLEAGELWRTEDVMEIFGTVFLMIKEQTRLWVERLPDSQDMTTAQYEAFQSQVTALVDDVYHGLIELPKQGRTQNLRERFEEGLDEPADAAAEDTNPDPVEKKRGPGRPRKTDA